MTFTSLVLLAAAVTQASGISLPSHGHPHCNPNVTTPAHRAHIVSNYLNLWGGDLSLLNQTISPMVEFQGDRFPLSANNCTSRAGSRAINIQTSAEFGAFISGTRASFKEYMFVDELSFGAGNNVVVRWTMQGVIGENFSVLPTTLKPGDSVTYNGTEMLVLNPCTGLADKVWSAQDLVSFFHNLGLESVTV